MSQKIVGSNSYQGHGDVAGIMAFADQLLCGLSHCFPSLIEAKVGHPAEPFLACLSNTKFCT